MHVLKVHRYFKRGIHSTEFNTILVSLIVNIRIYKYLDLINIKKKQFLFIEKSVEFNM